MCRVAQEMNLGVGKPKHMKKGRPRIKSTGAHVCRTKIRFGRFLSLSASNILATGNLDAFPSDMTGFVRAEKTHDPGHLFWLSRPAQNDLS